MYQLTGKLLICIAVLPLASYADCDITATLSHPSSVLPNGVPVMVDYLKGQGVTIACEGSASTHAIKFHHPEMDDKTYQQKKLHLTSENFTAGYYSCECHKDFFSNKPSKSRTVALTGKQITSSQLAAAVQNLLLSTMS